MAMTRHQMRNMHAEAKQAAARNRPPNRKRVRAWLEPIRKAFNEMRSGEVLAARGYPVTRLNSMDSLARIDHCINGFVALVNRVAPDFDTSSLTSVSKKLSVGVLLEFAELEACFVTLNQIEEELMTRNLADLIEASITEQIKINLELMGATEQ